MDGYLGLGMEAHVPVHGWLSAIVPELGSQDMIACMGGNVGVS